MRETFLKVLTGQKSLEKKQKKSSFQHPLSSSIPELIFHIEHFLCDIFKALCFQVNFSTDK